MKLFFIPPVAGFGSGCLWTASLGTVTRSRISSYLGKTCVAVGIQVSDNDLQLVRLLGIVFKEKGHAILKAYAEATGKEECLELAAQIRKEIDKEIITARRLKSPGPSFWDFFVECMRKEK